MTRSVVHHTFTVERTFAAPPGRAFRAFEDPAIKLKWFAEGERWDVEDFTTDFRVGGWERSRFRFQGGPLIRNDTVYQAIVPDQRIVIAYNMTIGDKRISASLATIELEPAGTGTRLVFTEQGAFLDDGEQPKDREEGTREPLGKLGELLNA